MTNTPPPDFFNQQASVSYDERNRSLAPISDNLHFLIRLIVRDLPEKARILCIGVGTGAEILSLALKFPQWEFVGVDPSESMLDVCRQRLSDAGVAERCRLICGYVGDLPPAGEYDAVLSVLVAHFIPRAERLDFFRQMAAQTRAGGLVVNAEISFDLDSAQTGAMISEWKKVQELMGATAESLAAVPHLLRNVLTILPPDETERLMRDAGVKTPLRFFQSLMIHGWFGEK